MSARRGPTIVEHVILDRDGVLNVEAPGGWVLRVQDWRWVPGARDALAILARSRTLSVATNQSCVGRGLVARPAIDAVHDHLLADAGVTLGVYCCPHAPSAGCACRKPAPGMLLQALAATGIPAERTVFVGDSTSDLEAARRAGVTPILVRTGKGRHTETTAPATGVAVFDDLLAFAHRLSR